MTSSLNRDLVPSYYRASARPFPSQPALDEDARVDVCVIGAGFTGLSTALNLAEAGYRVAVLEAQEVGWGASGRNGGQINTGFAPGMEKLGRIVGADDAHRLWSMAEEAKDILKLRVERHGIECDLKWGEMHAAAKPSHMADMRTMERLYREEYGYEQVRVVDREEARELVASPRFHGGLLDSGGGHLHPLDYVRGLARASLYAGVRIYEGTPALSYETQPAPCVRTAGGTIRCEFLVLACNAHLDGLDRKIEPAIMPVGTYILATERMEAARARTLIRDDICVNDSNFVLDYFRLSGDHRLLFGGRVSYSGRDPENLPEIMRRRMLRTFPQLDDLAADYVWGGFVAITRNRLPHIGRLAPNVFFAQGFSGQGVALTGMAGKLIAEAVSGTAERFDVMARIPHRRFPGGARLRTPLLVLAMLYYRLRDLL